MLAEVNSFIATCEEIAPAPRACVKTTEVAPWFGMRSLQLPAVASTWDIHRSSSRAARSGL